MELKQIQVDKILANFSQPREHFDKEKIKELAESILSNGLINPITVREDPKRAGKFMIVAGERRWQAHRTAKIEKINAFVKKYKNDVDWQVESLVENWQREDLTSKEREDFTTKIWDSENFKTKKELAKRLGVKEGVISSLMSANYYRKALHMPARDKFSTKTILDTKGLEKKDKEKLLQKISKKEIPGDSEAIREIVRVIKKATPEVKKALLSDDITTDQAERITKLKTPQQQERAIKEHKNLTRIDEHIEQHVEREMTAREKRQLDKRLALAGTWISGFRGNVTETGKQLEKTFKFLIASAKFIPMMDEKQKEDLDHHLERLVSMLDKGKQLAEQIQEQI